MKLKIVDERSKSNNDNHCVICMGILNSSIYFGILTIDSYSISSSGRPEKVADESQTSQEWSRCALHIRVR